jgi:hypothetical protein
VDEDDFRERPRPKKRREGQATWAKDVFEKVRYHVLRETDDYVLKQNLARQFNKPEADIGSCLAALVRAGILTPLRAVDHHLVERQPSCKGHCNCHPRVHVGQESCFWQDGQWMVDGSPITRTRLRPMRGIRRKVQYFTGKFEPPQKAEWDGRANFIVRGEAFQNACEELGIPADPSADWICPKCSKKNKHGQQECRSYEKHCDYKRPDLFYWPVPVKYTVCKRCGAKLLPTDKHKVHHCNTKIVRDVMDT